MAIRLHRRYHVLRVLGRGGMGIVYGAWDRLTSREVALKRLLMRSSSAESRSHEHSADTQSVEWPAEANAADTSRMPKTAPRPPPSQLAERVASDSGILVESSVLDFEKETPKPDGAVAESQLLTRVSYGRRMQLASEFRTLASLHHPHIVSVLDYGFDEHRQPYYAMELLEAGRTILVAGAQASLLERCRLLAQVLQALSYLHRHGVIHRDLKPANILCVRSSVKITDFGIAATVDSWTAFAGTVHYMAPEILQGLSATAVSDLYSVGIIAHELLCGSFPFRCNSMKELLNEVLGPDGEAYLPARARQFLELPRAITKPVRLSPQQAYFAPRSSDELPELRKLPMGLADLVRRLLSRDPLGRPQSADAALADLRQACNGGLASDDEANLDPFLQAAPLIDRPEELQRMLGLFSAAQRGHGGLLLIGGESGVGKSRLMEEFRVQAMVRGATVLRGQAQPSTRVPFDVFIEVLRELAAYSVLEDHEASILSTLVHDLPAVLERALPEPAEPADGSSGLDSIVNEQRLHATIEAVLLRWNEPLVLALEDLHWMDPSSLKLLHRLGELAQGRPLLIVGTYRDDEQPTLPRDLPSAQVLSLGRMSRSGTADLCAAMLGHAHVTPELASRIYEETEGNPLFIVEAVRMLAEEAGSLSAIRTPDLLREYVPGSVRSVLRRRLQRVPMWVEPTLYVLAVAGREIDLRLLRALESDPDAWLEAGANASVLVVREGHWRFAHDKLREELLSQLSSDEKQALHLQVAITLERSTPETRSIAAALAYHYRGANQPSRAAHYAELAGEQALAAGALAEAVRQLVDALEQQGHVTVPSAEGSLARLRTLRLLATSYAALGRHVDCIRTSLLALQELGRPFPEQPSALHAATLAAVFYEAQRRLWPLPSSDVLAPERQREFLRLWFACSESLFSIGDTERAILGSLWALHAAEQLNDAPMQALYSALIGFVLQAAGLQALGRGYLQRAEHNLERSHSPQTELRIHRLRGLMQLQRGQYTVALRTHAECADRARQLGDDHAWLVCQQVQSAMHFCWGAHARAEDLLVTVLSVAEQKGIRRYALSARLLQAALWLRRGQADLAENALQTVRAGTHGDELEPLLKAPEQALRARLQFAQGQLDEAYAQARQAWASQEAISTPLPTLLESRYALLDIVLTCHEERRSYARRDGLSLCQQMVRSLQAQAKRVIYFQPRALISQARLSWLQGAPADVRAAVAALSEALSLSQGLGMLYDEGLAHAYLGLIAAHAGGPFGAAITPQGNQPGPTWRPRILGGPPLWPPARHHLRQAEVLLRATASPAEFERVRSALQALTRAPKPA